MRWAERRWGLYARYYDRFISFREVRRRSLELAAIQPGERVLISGCGTGLDFEFVPEGALVEAVDYSGEMLQQARGKALALGKPVRLRRMDATRLAYADGTFDVVVLHLIMAVVPDAAGVLGEASRVLKPAGRIALFDKYYAGPGRPRLVRRILNPLMRLAATDLNVRAHELAAAAGLRFVWEEPAFLRGMFRVARLEKITNIRT